MTKIRQYELDSTIHEDDKVIGTDGNPGVDLGRTKNFTIAALTAYLNTALEVDNMVGGSGTLNTIPMWTPDGATLGDSIITTDTSLPLATDGIVVNGKFRVEVPTGTNAFNVSNEVVSYINARFNAGIIDSNSSLGTAGQALLSTSTATEWGTFYIGYADQAGDFDIKFGYNDGVTNTTTHAVRVYAGSGITLTDNFPLGFSISADNQIPADNVTGAGTLNTIPLWTPDGQTIGDSIMVQTNVAPNTFVLDVGTTRIAEDSLTAGIFYGTSIYTTNLNGINGGTVTLNGDTILGNQSTDTLTVNSTSEFNADVVFDLPGSVEFRGAIKDSAGTLGTAGKILISDASGLVSWGDETTYTYSSSQDGSDVILQLTDGVTPQEISLLAGTNITLTDNGNNDITIDGAGDTTYSVYSQQAASDVEIILAGSDITESEVTLVAGNSISLTDDGSNNITIAATGGAANTEYDLASSQNGSNVDISLTGSDATTDTVSLTAGTNITLTDDGSNGVTIATASNVVTGSGTLNTLPIWTPDGQTLGDSSISFDPITESVIIEGTSGTVQDLLVTGIDARIAIQSNTAGDANLEFIPNATSNQAAVFELTSADTTRHFLWQENGNEIMRLKGSNGNLGLGVTNPTTKLHIDGGIKAENNGQTYFQVFYAAGNGFINTGTSGGTINLGAPGGNITNLYVQGYVKPQSGIRDVNDSIGTSGQVLSSTGTTVDWIDNTSLVAGTDISISQVGNEYTINLDIADVVTGTGTLNTIPMWTPDGTQLGDSYITLNTSGSPFINVSVPLTTGTLYVTNIFGADSGFVTLSGNVILGNASTDTISINGNATFNADVTLGNTSSQNLTVNAVTVFESSTRFASQLVDTAGASGLSGMVLTSTGTGVDWVNVSDLTDNVTGTGTANYGALWTDADTLGVALWRQTANNSIGIGLNANSVGQESIAFNGSESNGDFSTAFAYESITDGEFSVTLGKGGYSAGDHSTAIGYKGISLGECSISGGHSSSAGGDGAVALGHNASAGNYGVAKATSTFPNDQTTFDIYGIVGTVAVGTFLRYGPGFDNADPRIEVTQFTDLGNGAATITIASGIRPIAGELLVFEELTPQRDDHQGGVALGNDAFSLGQGAVALGQDAVASADFAVAIGRTANTSTTDSIALGGGSTKILIEALVNASSYADDTAAAAGGVAIGELYRNGNVVQIRLT